MALISRSELPNAKRVVVKVGTAVVTRSGGGLALGRLGTLVEQLAAWRAEGREVVLVSSGAVGLGARRLGFPSKPKEVVDRQACAAAGQGALIALYDSLARHAGLTVAQVLLTEEDFLNRARYLNLRATLDRLLELGALPVINENDTVSTAELALHKGQVFGDNDRLSALVAAGLDADALLLLSDVDGLYTAHPAEPGAARIPTFGEASFAIGAASAGGRGGMGAKVAAAEVAQRAGVAVVIASGHQIETVGGVLRGDDIGTFFPAKQPLNARQRWLAYATAPNGRLRLNAGAAEALVARNASLLPVGITAIDGDFEAGAVVSLLGPDGVELARGITRKGATEARLLLQEGAEGRNKPLVHRDDLVLLGVALNSPPAALATASPKEEHV